jgi:hypothetical protein
MPDLDRAIDAYRAAEPRRSRDPFADRALRDRLAAVGASREGRRGVRGLVASWFAAVPGRALASGTLSLALLFVGLSGVTGGAAGGAASGPAPEVSNMAAVKSSATDLSPLPPVAAPGGESSEALEGTGHTIEGWSDATLLVALGVAGVIGSLLSAELVRRRRRS